MSWYSPPPHKSQGRLLDFDTSRYEAFAQAEVSAWAVESSAFKRASVFFSSRKSGGGLEGGES